MNYDLFISYADADRAWVEGYLRDAIEKAGARCLTEAAFELGVPRLLEFERAIQSSRRALLVLSPAYIADDLNQFANLLAQSYGLETAIWPVIPLILKPVPLPQRLAMLTALDATDAGNWENMLARLCAELQRPVAPSHPKPHCPYPGMAPFHEDDSARFFGRDREIQDLLSCLRLHPFLTVIGPSGSGKSSVVFAGLVPALRETTLFDSGEWLVLSLRPGEKPLTALTTLLGDLTDHTQAINRLLANKPNARRVLLVIDQFEEVFTQARAEAVPFQQTLLQLARTPNCYVVLTVRADFYPDLMTSPLWNEIQAHRIEILPLDSAGLREAIVRPAESVNVFVEAALVERLVADAAGEPGILPLAQETLVLLWDRLERRFLPLRAYEALVLPRRAYDKAGEPPRTGLQVAMARRADAALAELNATQQKMARRIFLRLIQFGEGRADTRRQQAVSDLRAAGDDPSVFEETLRHFANCRLLTLSGEEKGGARRVDIAHEALITGWHTLQQWVSERREAEQTRRRLAAKADEWARLGCESAGLLDEVELKEASDWLESADAAELGYDATLSALVEASRHALDEARREKEEIQQRELAQARKLAEEQRQRAEERTLTTRRLRLGAILLAVVAVLAVIAAGVAVLQTQQAQIQEQNAKNEAYARATEIVVRSTAEARALDEEKKAKQEAEQRATAEAIAKQKQQEAETQARISDSRRLAAQSASNREQNFPFALLLGLEAIRLDNNLEALSNLLDSQVSKPQLANYLHGHTGAVRSVAFSFDGKTLASGSWDNTIILWDVATRQMIGQPLKGHTYPVWSVAFSPDGKTLASGSYDKTIILWDVVTRRMIGQPLTGHTTYVKSVVFSPNGKTLASGSVDRTIILWDVATRQMIDQPLKGHSSYVNSIAFSPDGKTLVSAGEDMIILWDVATRQMIGQPLKDTSLVESIAFSPDGKMLASGDWHKTIILWDVVTRQMIGQPLEGHTAYVRSVAFSPDGKTLASASEDKTIILWNIATRQMIGQPLKTTSSVASVAFSPDGKMLVSGSGDKIILWDAAIRPVIGQPLKYTSPVRSVAFSPDSKTLASGNRDNMIILWDVTTRQRIGQPLEGHTAFVNSVAFSPDGKTLASASEDQTIILWNIATRQMIGQPLKATSSVASVAFSADGKMLVSGSGNKIILWDAATGQMIGQPFSATLLSAFSVLSVSFSPDGRMLASASEDSTVVLWDVAARQRIGQPLKGHTAYVQIVTFSPDGKTLASGSLDNTIILWDVVMRKMIGQPLKRHTDAVYGVAFSPDGKTLASAGWDNVALGNWDNTVILWDVATRQMVGQPLKGHTADVWSIAFSPDGKTLASGSLDKTIIMWDMDFESWKSRACYVANRNLTIEEWKQYINSDPSTYRATCPDLPLEPLATPTPQPTKTP